MPAAALDRPTARLTPKQEAFARAAAIEEASFADAYRKAYNAQGMAPKTIHEAASRLAVDSKVAARIAEIRDDTAYVRSWTIDRMVRAAIETHELACQLRQMGPATQALTLAARILGYDVAHKRNETDITIRVIRDGHNGATQLEAVDAEGVRLLSTSVDSDNSDEVND